MGKLNGEVYPVFFSEDGNVYGIKMSKDQYERFKILVPVIFGEQVVIDDRVVMNEFKNQFRLDKPEKQKS